MVASQRNEEMRELRHHTAGYNYTDTITTSVTIRVTPGPEDFLASWGILWGCFIVLSMVCTWQVIKENRILASRRQSEDVEQAPGGDGEGEGVSTADITRTMFRKLLLLAMVTRLISMPIQIWADPLWFQFVGDTLPEMIYASAWTMLVSFFVQLVGIATGTGTDTSPGIVIQATAYVVYICLIGTQIWNSVASILLYALLCCIYAALFGTVVYFCPRLLALLQPSLVRHSGLAVRLSICTVLCIIVFGAHTVGFARKVVAPPKQVYWWWTYGALELIPAAIFLIIMHPSSNKADRNVLLSPAAENAAVGRKPLRRSESGSSAGGNKRSNETKSSETTSLLKGPVSYGATTAESAA